MAYTKKQEENMDTLESLESIAQSLKEMAKIYADDSLRKSEAMTREQIAQEFGCSVQRLADWHNLGMLQGVKVGKNYIYLRENVIAFFNEYRGYDVSNYIKAEQSKCDLEHYVRTHVNA